MLFHIRNSVRWCEVMRSAFHCVKHWLQRIFSVKCAQICRYKIIPKINTISLRVFQQEATTEAAVRCSESFVQVKSWEVVSRLEHWKLPRRRGAAKQSGCVCSRASWFCRQLCSEQSHDKPDGEEGTQNRFLCFMRPSRVCQKVVS